MKQFIVDAFTDIVFKGNPAAVCLVEQPLTDEQMQLIAIENNLSETAFVQAAADGNGFDLRWFTPGSEVDLCGHATLATAFVIFNECNFKESTIVFHTMSGDLFVNRVENGYEMTFPAYELTEVPVTAAMETVLGVCPEEAYMGRDLLCVLPDESFVTDYEPKSEALLMLDGLLVHTTAAGSNGFA